MLFQSFREFGYPTLYPPFKAFHCDAFLITFLYFFGSIVFSFFIILPGVRGKQRIFTFLYGCLSFLTGMMIIICNYSYTWETASITTVTPYRTGSSKSLHCRLAVNVGLRGFNVTMMGLSSNDSSRGRGSPPPEMLDIDEAFRWTWQQGTQDPASPLAGRLVKDYRTAQGRGTPLPVLWIAQYFVMDGEKVRWGRHYRLAGYYTHIFMWLAFPFWLLGNILIYICIKYAGYFWISTGLSLIGANCLYYLIRCPIPLYISFPDATMKLGFGTSFWITLYIGILSIAIGTAIVIADNKCYHSLMAFFGIDVLQEYEDYIVDPTELGLTTKMTSPVTCLVKQSTKIVDASSLETGIGTVSQRVTGNGDGNNFNNNNSNETTPKATMNPNTGDTCLDNSFCFDLTPSKNHDHHHQPNGQESVLVESPGSTSRFVTYSTANRSRYPITDSIGPVSSNQIPFLKKRGTSVSFFQKRKFSPKKPHLVISKSVPVEGISQKRVCPWDQNNRLTSISNFARRQSNRVKRVNLNPLKSYL